MREHDNGYKLLFAYPRLVEDLLRGYVHEAWVDQLDFSTLERVSGSFTSDDLRERHNDLLWRALWKPVHGEPCPVYILLEFQSQPHPFMPVRILAYEVMLLQELIRRNRLGPRKTLPPVIGIAVYRGKPRWRAPLMLEQLFPPVSGGLDRHLPRFEHILLDERRLEFDDLEASRNLAGVVFRLETVTSPEEVLDLWLLLHEWLPHTDAELRRTFTVWMLRVLHRSFPGVTISGVADLEDLPMLEENMKAWRRRMEAEARREGRKEGRDEGWIEAMRQLLLDQMKQRFGRVPLKIRAQVKALDSKAELRRLSKKLLSAGSLEEMGFH